MNLRGQALRYAWSRHRDYSGTRHRVEWLVRGPLPDLVAEGSPDQEVDCRQFVERDADHKTSHAGVSVAGDMTRGASLVVRAINDGCEAARSGASWLETR